MPFGETLTGFKWIVRAADDLAFGYEEALGYCVLPDVVRDKDGISAALLVSDLAAALKAEGRTLPRPAGRAGRGVRPAHDRADLGPGRGPEQIADDDGRAAGRPAGDAAGRAGDRRGPAAGRRRAALRAERRRVVVRPSGTEPKLKAYLEVVGDPAGVDALRAELAPRLGP